MSDTQRQPLFLSICPDCYGRVRWLNGRPEEHKCLREQDDATATPWKEGN